MGDKYTGAKQAYFSELEQVTSTDLNRIGRLASRYFQGVLRYLLSDEDRAPQNGVLFGYDVTAAASLSLAVDVAVGMAYVDNATGLDEPTIDSRYRVLELETAETDLTFDAADATHPRIDAVYIAWAESTSVEESRNVRATPGGSPSATDIDTMRGSVPTLAIAKGTAASSPSAPSVPSNAIRLANVTIPALATSSSSLTVSDQRPLLPTCQQPGTLAGGTTVDGNLTATGGVTAVALTATGVGSIGSNLDVAGTTVSGDFKSDSSSDTAPAITTRSASSGTPDSSDDSVIVEVERGSSANAGVRWDEGVDAWQVNNGDGAGYRALASVSYYEPVGPSLVTDKQAHFFFERQTLTFVGGSPTETIAVTFNNDYMAGINGANLAWVFTQIQDRSGSSAKLAYIGSVLMTFAGGNLTVGTVDGTNLTGSDTLTVDFMVVGNPAA